MREAAPLMVLLTTMAKTYQTVLVDISATGARLEGDDLPPVGAELCVTVNRSRPLLPLCGEGMLNMACNFTSRSFSLKWSA